MSDENLPLNDNKNRTTYCDCRGTKQYNKRLFGDETIFTRGSIVSIGIVSNRIKSALGFGESQLLNN